VELSVNGKVVARGELVEVEGQLGVRVLSLAG
jgi:flagellar motor switch protein FliM